MFNTFVQCRRLLSNYLCSFVCKICLNIALIALIAHIGRSGVLGQSSSQAHHDIAHFWTQLEYWNDSGSVCTEMALALDRPGARRRNLPWLLAGLRAMRFEVSFQSVAVQLKPKTH